MMRRTATLLFLALACAACKEAQVTDDPVPLTDSLSARANSLGKLFGTAVVRNALFNEEEPGLAARYREVVASQFDLVVPESEMKMAAMWISEDSIDFTRADEIADWATENGLKMRGHVLVWHRSLPAWLVEGFRSGRYDGTAVAGLVEWYVTRVMRHFRDEYPGLVIAWDVVNEAIGPNDPRADGPFGLRPPGADYGGAGEDFWRQALGDDYAASVFRWARAADPDAKLFYNDYHAEYANPKGEAIYAFVTGLVADGVPIDGVGLQCHFSVSYLDLSHPGIEFSPQAISAAVDRWIATGLEVEVTEADIGAQANQGGRQALLYADLLRATLLKDGVGTFTTWGFTDLVSWRSEENPLYFDRSINPKESYRSMLEVLMAAD